MKVQCAFILLFSCFLVVAAVDVPCPSEGVTLGCKCTDNGDLRVECKSTKIIDVPSWLPNNTKLLIFENCNIRSLSYKSFKNLENLTSLTISKQQNGLTFNDSLVFQGLRLLRQVFLDDVNIVSLPAGLFANLSTLRYVSVNNNPLQTLPDDLFQNSPNVISLGIKNTQLNRNIIANITSGLFGKKIVQLFMSGTIIGNLHNEFFSGLPKLRDLESVSCGIQSVGDDILKGTDVSSINFNYSPIKKINENAFRYSKVSQFECEECQLTSKVAFNGFLKIRDLNKINLKNNSLTNIPEDAFTGLNNLAPLYLGGNPLICDCDLVWLRSFADGIRISDKDSWLCALPQKLSGQRFISLNENEICNMSVTTKPTDTSTDKPTDKQTDKPTSDGTFSFISMMTLISAVICYIATA